MSNIVEFIKENKLILSMYCFSWVLDIFGLVNMCSVLSSFNRVTSELFILFFGNTVATVLLLILTSLLIIKYRLFIAGKNDE